MPCESLTARIAAVSLLLIASTAPVMAIEEPEFEVLHVAEDYEIRRYAPYIVAELDVDGGMRAAGNSAFKILAGYIFGDNVSRTKMSMTAPVESRPAQNSTRMSMTAPVAAERGPEPGSFTYSFVMERRYTLETLPKPNNPRIRLVPKPARIMAVHRYSGSWSDANYRKHEDVLLEALRVDQVGIMGEPVSARYNSPFMPSFLRRNEVLIEIAWP